MLPTESALQLHVRRPSSGFPQSIDSQSAATHWRSAEYAGHGEHLGVVEFHDYLFETTDLGCDQAAAYTSGSFEDSDHATFKIYVKDNIELHAVCDIFSRLGTVDIAQRSLLRRAIRSQRKAELRATYSVLLGGNVRNSDQK